MAFGLRNIPLFGNFLGDLLGEKTHEEQGYLAAIERAKQLYQGYMPEYQQMQEQALQNQTGATAGWDQLLAEIYGSQYLPHVNTQSPVTAAAKDNAYQGSGVSGSAKSKTEPDEDEGVGGYFNRKYGKK